MSERLTCKCLKNIAPILVTLIEVDDEDLTFESKCLISADEAFEQSPINMTE